MKSSHQDKLQRGVPSIATVAPSTVTSEPEKVAARLKFLRLHFGLTQTQLAKTVGVAQQIVAAWEAGTRKKMIGIDNALKLCVFYDVSLDFIYRGRTDAIPLKLERAYKGLD